MEYPIQLKILKAVRTNHALKASIRRIAAGRGEVSAVMSAVIQLNDLEKSYESVKLLVDQVLAMEEEIAQLKYVQSCLASELSKLKNEEILHEYTSPGAGKIHYVMAPPLQLPLISSDDKLFPSRERV